MNDINLKKRFREDLIDGNNCPECDGDLGESRQFNLMFKTFMGPLENDSAVVYLRPETAQAMFVNFDNVHTTSRKKIPFGNFFHLILLSLKLIIQMCWVNLI